jgi:hypothetical protein
MCQLLRNYIVWALKDQQLPMANNISLMKIPVKLINTNNNLYKKCISNKTLIALLLNRIYQYIKKRRAKK